ncbi:MAG: hypothetical protein JWO09_2818 [Bacteroidetes bacterium]|nr:hypothetical protein [Bacteroidota bacterium]
MNMQKRKNNNEADQVNKNGGTPGTNTAWDAAQENRRRQLEAEKSKKAKPSESRKPAPKKKPTKPLRVPKKGNV